MNTYTVSVDMIIDAENEDEAIEKAYEEIKSHVLDVYLDQENIDD